VFIITTFNPNSVTVTLYLSHSYDTLFNFQRRLHQNTYCSMNIHFSWSPSNTAVQSLLNICT